MDTGATGKTRDEKGCISRDSGLHWLTAFDEQHVAAALNLLDQAEVGQEQAPEISWNHPSIDLPGYFLLTPGGRSVLDLCVRHQRLAMGRVVRVW